MCRLLEAGINYQNTSTLLEINLMEGYNHGKATNLNMNRDSLMCDLGSVDPDGTKELKFQDF